MKQTAHFRYPPAVDAGRGQLARESDYDQYIRQLILQVLFTAPGERINRPTFGAGLKRLVFAPNSPATASLAQTTVYQALQTWMGSLIRTDDVKAEADSEKLNITITYTVLARGEQRFLNVEVTL